MTIFVRSDQAARILGVSKTTLYAYVSRGRVERVLAADGRTSLFDKDKLEALVEAKGSHRDTERPSIDAQIESGVTLLAEDAVTVRGHALADLVTGYWFEDVAELLWTSKLPDTSPTPWPVDVGVSEARVAAGLDLGPIARLSVLAHLLQHRCPHDDGPTAARRLLSVAPIALGSAITEGTLAERLAGAYVSEPDNETITAVDTALGLLCDHGLATSTLAVRVAASVRPSPYEAFAAGLATVAGRLHGAAARHVMRFLIECDRVGVGGALDALAIEGRRVPGFGHTIYRGVDPRFGPLFDAVAPLDTDGRLEVVGELQAVIGQTRALYPNIDLALGALLWVGGFGPDAPFFAVARIAGWAAHFEEELQARPVRYRGLARTPG